MPKIIDPTKKGSSPFGKFTIGLVPSIVRFITPEKRLKEEANLLFSSLDSFGISVEESPLVYYSTRKKSVEVPLEIPYAFRLSLFEIIEDEFDIIDNERLESRFKENYFVTAKSNNGQRPITALIATHRYYKPSYTLTLLAHEELSLENALFVKSLPINPFQIGFSYYLHKNPLAKEMLSLIKDAQIPAGFFSGSDGKSNVLGCEGESGLRI